MTAIDDLQDHVAAQLHLLAPVERSWQPTDFLPDLAAEDWMERLARFRDDASRLPDDLLVVLVGNMVTEEALPNYTTRLARVAKDPTGADDAPWARWLRGWTAEENRHGDLLNAYLRLTGRVDMRAVELTVHRLIRDGFAPDDENDYAGMVYTSFQERATRLAHGNLARLALGYGEEGLARICRKIAGDEARHEAFYTGVVSELFERDPEEAMLAYRSMLRRVIAMPGSRMSDGHSADLFGDYAAVASRCGAYTTRDYASIIRHLNAAWGVERRSFTGRAARAQDYVCRQPERYEDLAGEIEDRVSGRPPAPFSWLYGRIS